MPLPDAWENVMPLYPDRLRSALHATLAMALLAPGAFAAASSPAERIAADARSETDRARDADRRPAEVLAFLAGEEGLDGVDVVKASGWSTAVLSFAAGRSGTVATQNPDFILAVHDVDDSAGRDAAIAMPESVKSVLEPGGIFGIVDPVGGPEADNAALYRLERAKVLDAARAAGFALVGESEMLASAEDDHTQGVFAEGPPGNTDRFVPKLRRPAA
jgi:predicted methyltransferase